VIVAGVGFGIVTVIAGLMPSYVTFAAVLPLAGFTALTMITTANAFVQLTTAPEIRGRIVALYFAIFMGGTPLGAPLLGWISDTFGARWTLIGGGALTALGTLAATAFFARRQGVAITPHLRPTPHLAVGARDVPAVTDTVIAA
jgi:MFS family permease